MKPLKADTIPHLDILNKFKWHVKILTKNNSPQLCFCHPDSLEEIKDIDTVYLSTTFKVDSRLVNQYYGIEYELNGSLSLNINGKNIVGTGTFSSDKYAKLNCLFQKDNAIFFLNDTTVIVNIIYLPHPKTKVFKLGLLFGDKDWAYERKQEQENSKSESVALGFFYLAYGIIFLLFFLFPFQLRFQIANANCNILK